MMMNLFRSIEINDKKIGRYTKARHEPEWSMYTFICNCENSLLILA